jgi:hypothetical protein
MGYLDTGLACFAPAAFQPKQMTIDELKYVFWHYGHLMTTKEKWAYKHLAATLKATRGRSDAAAQAEVKSGATHFRKQLSGDPAVLDLVRDGYDPFVIRTGQRILNEHRDKIVLNRCPKCGVLARTPKARQCRFCGHDWHT